MTLQTSTGLAESKLGTLRETQCEKNQPLERVIFGKSDP